MLNGLNPGIIYTVRVLAHMKLTIRLLHPWIKGREPGDQTGDGFGKLWHMVKEALLPMWSGH